MCRHIREGKSVLVASQDMEGRERHLLKWNDILLSVIYDPTLDMIVTFLERTQRVKRGAPRRRKNRKMKRSSRHQPNRQGRKRRKK